jgi:hypothetical protein
MFNNAQLIRTMLCITQIIYYLTYHDFAQLKQTIC